MSKSTRSLIELTVLILIASLVCLNGAIASLDELSNERMSSIHGRTQFIEMDVHDGNVNVGEVDNTGLSFVRFDINAAITGLADRVNCDPPNCDRTQSRYDGDGVNNVCSSAGTSGCSLADGSAFQINTLKLGHYNDGDHYWGFSQYSPENTNEFDIRASSLELPNEDRGQIKIRGPYVNLAYENMQDEDPTNNQLVGIRIGAKKIRGGGTLNVSQGSWSIRGSDFNAPCYVGGCVSTNQHRDDSSKAIDLFAKIAFGVNYEFGDNDGWTEDLWISFQDRDIFWEKQNPAFDWSEQSPKSYGTGEIEFHEDGKGFWIHATDDIAGGLT